MSVSQLFGQASGIKPKPEVKRFGHTYGGRYHMPLLPGEDGTKAGGDYVPRGDLRTTNLIGAISDTRALSAWEQEQELIGLAFDPSLYEHLVLKVQQWRAEGVDLSSIRDHLHVREELVGLPFDSGSHERSIAGRAKQAAGANIKREMGTNRHTAWEARGAGQAMGTPAIQQQIVDVEAALAAHGLVRVPGLQERVVRNVTVGASGKFDDVLLQQSTGRLLMADLKTKQRDFYSFLEVDAQLATYANAEWMLTPDGQGYEPGPRGQVDMTEGVVIHMPSDGAPPRLRRADLAHGWRVAQLCRAAHDERAYAKSAERMGASYWPVTS